MILLTALGDMHFFSLYGLIAVIIAIIPNLLFMKKAQSTRPTDINTPGAQVSFFEFSSRFLLNFALVLVEFKPLSVYWLAASAVIYALYFIMWLRFAIGGCYYPDIYLKKFLGIPIPIDIFNALYFCVVSIWLCNFIALVLALIYSFTRIMSATFAYLDLASRVEN